MMSAVTNVTVAAALAGDVERLARLQREAELLAALNHANIAHIYGLEGQVGQAGQAGQNESGLYEVYVRDFPSGGNVHQVPVNGGDAPRWSPRGDELFFVANDMLMSAAVTGGDALRFGAPHALFTAAAVGAEHLDYDGSKDGQRFILVRTIEHRRREAVVVENWLSRLASH
jgi:hypothetical protein